MVSGKRFALFVILLTLQHKRREYALAPSLAGRGGFPGPQLIFRDKLRGPEIKQSRPLALGRSCLSPIATHLTSSSHQGL